jgi:hypothetical protein
MGNATTFIKERKNILIISIVVLVAVLIIYFIPSDKTQVDLGILSDQMPSIIDDSETSKTADSSPGQEQITIPEETELYCEWVWPQKIINKETKEVYWTCPMSNPYCKSGTSECCTKGHNSCIEMNN